MGFLSMVLQSSLVCGIRRWSIYRYSKYHSFREKKSSNGIRSVGMMLHYLEANSGTPEGIQSGNVARKRRVQCIPEVVFCPSVR